MRVVVKIGTSSLTTEAGHLKLAAITKLAGEVAALKSDGHDVVVVTSAAITAGLPALGYVDGERPRDTLTLQAAAAVGQSRLLRAYDEALNEHQLVGGQVLLSANDFFARRQYLHARDTLTRLLALGVVPIINENDAVADDEIRFGDNDRLAALVAHALDADLLVLLTDTAGLFTADPRFDENASLVEEVTEFDNELHASAGASGTSRGSGGMASKLAAARMATWTGVRAVIAAADRDNVVQDAVAGAAGVGTTFAPRDHHLSARKLWIAFALKAAASVTIDAGAAEAVLTKGSSLLAAGVTSSEEFSAGSGIEIRDDQGALIAKGIARIDSGDLAEKRSVVVHRDDLATLI